MSFRVVFLLLLFFYLLRYSFSTFRIGFIAFVLLFAFQISMPMEIENISTYSYTHKKIVFLFCYLTLSVAIHIATILYKFVFWNLGIFARCKRGTKKKFIPYLLTEKNTVLHTCDCNNLAVAVVICGNDLK